MRGIGPCILAALTFFTAACHNSNYFVERGNVLVRSGKFEEAFLNYSKALQKDPNSADAHFGLGISEIKLRHLSDALEELQRATSLAPARDDIRLQLGELCLSALIASPKLPETPYQCLKDVSGQFVAKDPNSFAGLRFKGYLALYDRRLDDAIDFFSRAHQLKPNQPDVAISLADALFQNNQDQEAEHLTRDFIQANPSYGPAYDALYAHYSAHGRVADAIAIWTLKIANNPGKPVFVTDLAGLYWRLGRQNDALNLIGKLLGAPERQASNYVAAGDFYGSIGRWQDARTQFEEGIRIAPEEKSFIQKRIVNALLTEGKPDEAAALVDEILKRQPHDWEALAARAGLRLARKDPQSVAAAVADYSAVVQATPDDSSLRYRYGQALEVKGDLSTAKSQFEEAIRLQPEYGDPRKALADLALRQDKLDEAVKFSDEAIRLNPQDASAMLLKAVALMRLTRDAEAREELGAVLRMSPGNAEALLRLALLDIHQKEFQAAEALLTRLRAIEPAAAAGGFAVMYATQGQIDKAVELLKKVSLQPDDHILIHNMLAALALHAHRDDVAIEEYKILLAGTPDSTDLLLNLSEAYQRKSDWDDSIAVLRRAQKVAPRALLPTAMLASSLAGSGRLDLALAQYRRALSIEPDNPKVLNNLAYLIVETQGDVDEAFRLSQRAVHQDPNDPQFADTLGWIYVKRNMSVDATQIFTHLVDKYPNDPAFRYHLGVALLRSGAQARARETLEAALAKGPSKQDAEKIRALLKRTD